MRAEVGNKLLQGLVQTALEQVVIPEGWVMQRNPSSVMYANRQHRLPHIKAYYDKYRVDVDVGRGCDVKSTRQEFDSAEEMAKYVQSQIWSFAQ
jgi:hypothetical protein